MMRAAPPSLYAALFSVDTCASLSTGPRARCTRAYITRARGVGSNIARLRSLSLVTNESSLITGLRLQGQPHMSGTVHCVLFTATPSCDAEIQLSSERGDCCAVSHASRRSQSSFAPSRSKIAIAARAYTPARAGSPIAEARWASARSASA